MPSTQTSKNKHIKKENEMNFKDLKIGDEVKSSLKGWGNYAGKTDNNKYVVRYTSNGGYKFDVYDAIYTEDGFASDKDIKPEIIKVKKFAWNPSINNSAHIQASGFIISTKNVIPDYEGRTYKTTKEAKQVYHQILRPCQRMAAWAQEHAPDDIYNIDFGNENQYKYYVYYNSLSKKWEVKRSIYYIYVGCTYFLKLSIAEQLAKGLNDKTIKL